ncbi:hypothetical protein JCM10450v2_000939 [Rhodotorula kratochvilovae]
MSGSFDAAAVAKAEELRLRTFTSETAFVLGSRLREHIRSKYAGQPAIIDIRSAVQEQQLFFATCAEGSLPDNAFWAQRKRNAVLRFGKSTAALNLKWGNAGVPSHYGVDNAQFACHGGGFPLRVKGVESLVGVVVVSGLKQEEDHQVIVDVLAEVIEEQEMELAAQGGAKQ